MNTKDSKLANRAYDFCAQRPYTVIIFITLFCNLAAKLFHSIRLDLTAEYISWILADITVLLTLEAAAALICFKFPKRAIIRTVTIFTAFLCTWSVMNAAWIIRTGTQILPTVILPLLRDPVNALTIVGSNLARMPVTAVILLGPSTVALAFFFSVLANTPRPNYNRRVFFTRISITLSLAALTVLLAMAPPNQRSPHIASKGLRYNCHLKAITALFFPPTPRQSLAELNSSGKTIPTFDQIQISKDPAVSSINKNIVIVVLEGVQYSQTSMADPNSNLTPYMASIAASGAEFANTRSSLTHTTKALFALHTGRIPSVSQDIAETIRYRQSCGW